MLGLDLPVRTKYLAVTILPQARLLKEIDKLIRKRRFGEPLTPAEAVFAQSLSSVYKFKLDDLRNRALWQVKRKYNELGKGFRRAKRDERPEEQRRILETLKEVEEMVDDVEKR